MKCRNNRNCRKRGCKLIHTERIKCRFDENCEKSWCTFKHSNGKELKSFDKEEFFGRKTQKIPKTDEKSYLKIKQKFERKRGDLFKKLNDYINQRENYEYLSGNSFILKEKEQFERNMKNLEDKISILKNFLIECGKYEGSNDVNLLRREIKRFESELPIFTLRSEILSKDNDVVILKADPGSGKSTQICQYFLDENYTGIVCTQPYEFIVHSITKRVVEEYCNANNRDLIGKFNQRRRKLKFTTDKYLLNEITRGNENLEGYNVVIIDEAHERTIETDLLICCLRVILEKRKDLKVIITSATLDCNLFFNYFKNPKWNTKMCNVSYGQQFEVETEYLQNEILNRDSYFKEIENNIIRIIKQKLERKIEGNVMIFLQGSREVEKVNKMLKRIFKDQFSYIAIFKKIHEQLNRLFSEERKDKIIVTTKIAETSITVPNISFIIDSGLKLEWRYCPKRGIEILEEGFISQSSADQRRGRTGRVCEGKCFRLYTERMYDKFRQNDIPEIKRINFGLAILKLLKLGSGILEKKNLLMESPDSEIYVHSLNELIHLKAITSSKELTKLGKFMSEVPFTPIISKILYEGKIRNCESTMIEIASIVSCDNIFKKNSFGRFKFSEGSQNDVLSAFRMFEESKKIRTYKQKVEFAKKYGIYINSLDRINRQKRGIENILCVERSKKSRNVTTKEILEILTECLSLNSCVFINGSYFSIKLNENVNIHPSSLLYNEPNKPKFILFFSVSRSSKTFIRKILPVVDEKKLFLMYSKQSKEVLEKFFKSFSILEKQKKYEYQFGPSLINRITKKIEFIQKNFECILTVNQPNLVSVAFINEKLKLKFDEYVNFLKKQIKSEEIERYLKFGVRIYVSEGGITKKILLADEFDHFQFRYPKIQKQGRSKMEAKRIFEMFGKINEFTLNEDKLFHYGSVRYDVKTNAKRAVNGIKDLELFDNIQFREYGGDVPTNSKVVVKFFAGELKDFGFIFFSSLNDFNVCKRLFTNKSFDSFKVQKWVSAGTKLSCHIKLLKELSEFVLENYLKKKNINCRVKFARKEAVDEKFSLEDIKRVFSKFGKISNIRIKPYNSSFRIFNVTFSSKLSSKKCVNYYGKRKCTGLFPSKNIDLFVEKENSVRIVTFRDRFDVLKEDYKEIKKKMEKKGVVFNENFKSKKVFIWIESKSGEKSFVQAAYFFVQTLFRGEIILKENGYFLFRNKEFENGVRNIESIYNVLIKFSKKLKEVRLFCESGEKKELVVSLIKSLVDYLEERLCKRKVVFEVFSKKLMEKIEVFIEKMNNEIHSEWKYENKRVVVYLQGSKVVVNEVLKFIETQKLGMEQIGNNPHGDCGICLEQLNPEGSYKLDICGCVFCKSCLRQMLNFNITSKKFPIVCPSLNCKKTLVIRDIVGLLNEKEMEELIKQSFEHFKLSNQKQYPNCPTPNCCQIFSHSNDEDDLFECCECGSSYCKKCSKFYHEGSTCAQAKSLEECISISDMKKMGIKKCGCGTLIQKNGGCNHIECKSCKKHICWKCLNSFKTSTECYSHISSCRN